MEYKEIDGDLIVLARDGYFDVIAHGCNCFCTQKKGIAAQMALVFDTDTYPMEDKQYRGDINKLGNIDYDYYWNREEDERELIVVNCYTQFQYATKLSKPPIDYEALTLCMRKINKIFSGKRVGLPKIGSDLAGGDWSVINNIIKTELTSCNVTIVKYDARHK